MTCKTPEIGERKTFSVDKDGFILPFTVWTLPDSDLRAAIAWGHPNTVDPERGPYTNWYGQFSTQRLKLNQITQENWLKLVDAERLGALHWAKQERDKAEAFSTAANAAAKRPVEEWPSHDTGMIAERARVPLLKKCIELERQEWRMVKHLHHLDALPDYVLAALADCSDDMDCSGDM